MVTTDPESPVDVSPIVIHEIVVDGQKLVAREPLRFDVEYILDEDEPVFMLKGDFGLTCWAESRPALIQALEESLELYWEEFAEADPEELSPKAQEIRMQLRERLALPSHGA